MAKEIKEKVIVRTIVTGYKYDVMNRVGDTLTKVGTMETEKVLRSGTQTVKALVENGFDEKSIALQTGTVDKKYQISEKVFIENATEILE